MYALLITINQTGDLAPSCLQRFRRTQNHAPKYQQIASKRVIITLVICLRLDPAEFLLMIMEWNGGYRTKSEVAITICITSNIFQTCLDLLEGNIGQPGDNEMILIGWSSPLCVPNWVVLHPPWYVPTSCYQNRIWYTFYKVSIPILYLINYQTFDHRGMWR